MANYLVCTPVPTGQVQPTSYNLSFDGGSAVPSPAVTNPDSSVQLKYDLAPVASGAHSVTAVAVNSWGSSGPSAPFTFVKAVPATPINITILVA